MRISSETTDYKVSGQFSRRRIQYGQARANPQSHAVDRLDRAVHPGPGGAAAFSSRDSSGMAAGGRDSAEFFTGASPRFVLSGDAGALCRGRFGGVDRGEFKTL